LFQHSWLPEDGCSLHLKHGAAVEPTVQLVGKKTVWMRNVTWGTISWMRNVTWGMFRYKQYLFQHSWLPEDGCSLQLKHGAAVEPTVQLVGKKTVWMRNVTWGMFRYKLHF
jgi:hypothetical protein